MKWEDDIDRLDVTVRADLFEKDVWRLWRVGELEGTESLTGSKRGESCIVIATSCTRVTGDLGVEGRCDCLSVLVVVVEVLHSGGVRVEVAGPKTGNGVVAISALELDTVVLVEAELEQGIDRAGSNFAQIDRKAKDWEAVCSRRQYQAFSKCLRCSHHRWDGSRCLRCLRGSHCSGTARGHLRLHRIGGRDLQYSP